MELSPDLGVIFTNSTGYFASMHRPSNVFPGDSSARIGARGPRRIPGFSRYGQYPAQKFLLSETARFIDQPAQSQASSQTRLYFREP